jgi:RNA polymerase sigma-70 factor (sigma-E family)
VTVPFEEYVLGRGPRLLRFAYLLCGDRHMAEDLVQDVLARAHRRWSRIEAAQPDAYLRAALVRAHRSWLRRRSSGERTIGITPDLPRSPADPDFADRHALREEMWALLATLPRAQRAALVLRYFEDLDARSAAEILGCSESTVRVHVARGLGTLRSRLGVGTPARPPVANGDAP